MGAGRSGSTLLGIALGDIPGVFYAGELDTYPGRAGVPNGDDLDLREFWRRVASLVQSRPAPSGDLRGVFEHPSGLFRPWNRKRALRDQYLEFNQELLAAVSSTSGCDTIVDSSHLPLRCWNLRRLASIDLYTLFLVRDPRAVIAAFQRPVQRPKAPLASVAYIWAANALSIIVYWTTRSDRRRIVRYEDFVRDPMGCLNGLSVWLEADAAAVDVSALTPGHIFQGNRMRLDPVVAVDPNRLGPARVGRIAALLVSPWTIAFGYARRASRAGVPDAEPAG